MFYINFVSASESHILWLKYKIEELLKIKTEIHKEQGPIYALRFAKTDSKILISKMYYKPKLPCLMRKYKKLNKILKTNNKNSCGCGEMATALP